MGHQVTIPKLDIATALKARSRDPFRDILTSMLASEPTPEAVHEFANRFPDRWAQAVAIFARLSGFSEKVEIEENVFLDVGRLSDADLAARLVNLQGQLDRPG